MGIGRPADKRASARASPSAIAGAQRKATVPQPSIFEKRLGIFAIAKAWSVETGVPPENYDLALIRAWLRGEFAAAGPKRINVLRAAYETCEGIAFIVEGEGAAEGRRLEDGRIAYDGRPTIWIPSRVSWTEESCGRSFEEMAEKWDQLSRPDVELLLPVLSQIRIDCVEFLRWFEKMNLQPPTFWAAPPSGQKLNESSDVVGSLPPHRAERAHAPARKSRGRDPEAAALHLSRMQAVLAKGQRLAKQHRAVRSYSALSHELAKREHGLGFSVNTIRQILNGAYPPARRAGLGRLDLPK
jgi:hypothetical protein